jgi:alkylation response protein AidB-like acyl-CoA dehydrogenase|tara:strand:+ start:12364 stop:13503 length:1140 start_codon:yes stop_codon:yes gene_type:complete
MDFELSEEQRLLRDSIDRFVKSEYPFSTRQEIIFSTLGYSEKNWTLFAEMGWLALPFDAQYGGFDGSPVETAIVMEALGRGLVLEPYLSTVVMGGGLLAAVASHDQKERLIPQIVAGELTLAVAYLEPQSRFDPADVETSAKSTADGFVLSGHKCVVYQGCTADKIIVSARTHGADRSREGISLFILDQDLEGVSRKDYKTLDGQWASDFFFSDVNLPASALLGQKGVALEAIESTLDLVISAVCAEAVGAMAAANDITRDYIRVREQFGVPIGSFQVLQHRWVDMYMETEMAKSMSDVLAMRLRDRDEDSALMVAATKVRIGKAGLVVGQGATQLHGGVGMTNEYAVGHYYKRLMTIDILFGNQDYHCSRYEQLEIVA